MTLAPDAARRTSLGLTFEDPARPSGLARLLRWRARRPAALPPQVRVYAIGDIHGCADLLSRARDFVATEAASGPERQYLVFMGDYVDRGPDSKGVIDQLIEGVPGVLSVCLRGNHDQAMLNFLSDPGYLQKWKAFGGGETLRSYGVRPPDGNDDESLIKTQDALTEALPPEHAAFLENLPYYVKIGRYWFVHAGFRPGMPVARQHREDMLWIREDFLSARSDFGGAVVYGHTPGPVPVVTPDRIGIDTGAYASGKLTLAVFEGDARRFYAVSAGEVEAWD